MKVVVMSRERSLFPDIVMGTTWSSQLKEPAGPLRQLVQPTSAIGGGHRHRHRNSFALGAFLRPRLVMSVQVANQAADP